MHSLTLVLVVHDHQPVGNFDDVVRQAHDDAYLPFLEMLERHPGLRLALHTSGPLLEWLSAHRPAYLDRLRTLVEGGQVEPWGGAFYEPILSSIPEPDRQGQIRAMAGWLERTLGRAPRGLWLAERVWEPGLPSTLHDAGVEYIAVDDAHFAAAGFEREQLWGYFQTEDQGNSVAVFPIHRELRYLVPFGEPEETVAMLKRVAEGGHDRIAVLGDDGEKFGVWPGTHVRCYQEGWLERWARTLEENPWIELRTPGEAIARHAPRGIAYLPSAAYHELQEWALPPRAQERYQQAATLLEKELGDEARDLLRGGHWRNFLARYPESNRLHKRALRASRLLWAAENPADAKWREARDHLWRAQCNCPYWHGVFGGLYLPHLRSALHGELIAAERWLAPAQPRVEQGDIDLDGDEDFLLETPECAAWVSARGARLWAFDDRRRTWNYGDTLARRPEHYHAQLGQATVGGGEGQTIHGALRLKEPGLTIEAYDQRGRESFLDRWIPEKGEPFDWAAERFAVERVLGDVEEPASSAVEVALRAPESGTRPSLAKAFRVSTGGELEVVYRWSAESRSERGQLEVELNLGVHVRDAEDRYVRVNGRKAEPPGFGALARHSDVRCLELVDAWAGRRLAITIEPPAEALERSPIETVSLSEAGAERVFQGVSVRCRFRSDLARGREKRVAFRLAPGAASES